MLNIVLADSELELIPKKIVDHPVIQRSSKKRNKNPKEMILDSNFHHKAMEDLKENKRRGRPDIIHISLLCALESILNKDGKMNIYVHTRNDKVIEIKPETKIPRSYNRFLGLIEKLFQVNSVPKNLELLKLKEESLNNLLDNLDGKKFVMTENGKKIKQISEEFSTSKNSTVVIGGFPKGEYLSKPRGKKLSIYDEKLTAWTTLNELITYYERI